MKFEITLVYDTDCPNLPAARDALRKALEHEELEPQWVEYDRAAPGTPAPLLRFGSPTILVEGVDVAGGGGTCRRRVLSGLSGRARTFRRPVSRDYRSGNRESRGACEHAADMKVGSLRRALGLAERRQSHDREPFGAFCKTMAAKSEAGRN
jgi:hypothetical protein